MSEAQPTSDRPLGRVRIQVADRPPVSLSVIDVGPQRASPVLFFVQGAGGHALQWVNQLRHFSKDYRCLAPDLRGHGQSDKPRDGYTVDQVTDDLVAVLDGLHIREPVVLLAHSAGGLLGINFAARYPERLTKLVLVNTSLRSSSRTASVPGRGGSYYRISPHPR
jgi:pimeloyl-ACP methyl ester carboxylesterase